MAKKIDDEDRRVLEHLNKEDGAYQFNTWAIPSGGLSVGYTLASLKRRGLVDAEGRGHSRQWWITEDGKAALRATEATA
jgi:hypothetical protein